MPESIETRWMLLRAHAEEHGTHLEVLRELLERVVGLETTLERYANLDNWEHVGRGIAEEPFSTWVWRGGHPTPWVEAQEALHPVSKQQVPDRILGVDLSIETTDEQAEFRESFGYVVNDPKHPDYHSTYADVSDARD